MNALRLENIYNLKIASSILLLVNLVLFIVNIIQGRFANLVPDGNNFLFFCFFFYLPLSCMASLLLYAYMKIKTQNVLRYFTTWDTIRILFSIVGLLFGLALMYKVFTTIDL